MEELFSLLHFLEPSQFPSEAEFLKDFGDLKTEEQVRKRRTRRRRRMKEKTSNPSGDHEGWVLLLVALQI